MQIFVAFKAVRPESAPLETQIPLLAAAQGNVAMQPNVRYSEQLCYSKIYDFCRVKKERGGSYIT